MRGRRSAADFERALREGSLDPAPAAAVESVSRTAEELTRESVVRPEFRDELRQRLLAMAAVQPVGAAGADPVRERPRVRRRVVLAVCGLVAAGAVGGLTWATPRALPGEPLYAAKRATERLQLTTAGSPLDRGLRHLHIAETRLDEVRSLAGGDDAVGLAHAGSGPTASSLAAGSTDSIASALRDMDDNTRSGSALVEQAAREEGDAAPLLTLQGWSDQQAARLRDVVAVLPSEVRQRAESSLSVVHGVGAGASALLVTVCNPAGASPASSCGGVPLPGSVPSAGVSGPPQGQEGGPTPVPAPSPRPTVAPGALTTPQPAPSPTPTPVQVQGQAPVAEPTKDPVVADPLGGPVPDPPTGSPVPEPGPTLTGSVPPSPGPDVQYSPTPTPVPSEPALEPTPGTEQPDTGQGDTGQGGTGQPGPTDPPTAG